MGFCGSIVLQADKMVTGIKIHITIKKNHTGRASAVPLGRYWR